MRARSCTALGMVLIAMAVWMAPALAQETEPPPGVTLELKDAEVRSALEMLFSESGFSYVLSPGVQGRVTVSLHDVSWDHALRFVLDSLDLTYQREDNVYLIDRRAAVLPHPKTPSQGHGVGTDAPKPAATPGKQRLDVVKVLYSDPAMIAAVLGGTSVGYTYGGGGLAPYGIGTFAQPGLSPYGQQGVGTQPFGLLGPGMTGMTTPWSLGTSTYRPTGGGSF